jgi:hypothetical protein
LKYQRVNAHPEAAQFNGIVSGRPASAWGKTMARLGPPDTTFFISALTPISAQEDLRTREDNGVLSFFPAES